MTKITVYKTQFSGCCGPCVWDNAQDAITELVELVHNMEPTDTFTLTIEEMEKSEFDDLEEFVGY